MINAVIFDLDGTVLDNEGRWEAVFREIAEAHDMQRPMLGKWWHEPGIGILENWKKLVPDAVSAQKLAVETWNKYWEETQSITDVAVMPGLIELVEAVKQRNWLTGLATGSSWNIVENELEQLKLYMAFDVTTTGEEVMVQKPDPEIYMITIQKLGLDAKECIVVEDAIAGVRAGVDAGCEVIGLVSEYASAEELSGAGAKWTVDKLSNAIEILSSLA